MASTVEAKYEVCFVRNEKSDDDSAKTLTLAFEAMDSHDLEPKWIKEEECLKIVKKEAKLFVMDPFEGKGFNHLESLNNRIVGPLCVLSCLKLGETLPKRSNPVYSVSMRKITVTCSNVDKALREDISRKVLLMSGNFSKDLTKSVTHLVVGEVGSKKYHVAANFGLPIMEPGWVFEVWNSGQHQQLHATDPVYDKFRCPIFKGLSITVSQLGSEERASIKSLIENNGGRYSGALKSRETTHLVLIEPQGDKYKYAVSWKLHCVKVDWVYDSLAAGHCMDENLYSLNVKSSSVKNSTPTKNGDKAKLEVDCSVINPATISHLDETTRSEISVLPVKRNSILDVLDNFDINSLPKSSQFLDGCKFFLFGFNGNHLEKLRKIINAGGGMRFSKYSESVSHIIYGEKNADLLEIVKSSSVKPHIVNFEWLLECCKQIKLVDESPFSCSDFLSLSPQKECHEDVNTSTKSNSVVVLNDNDVPNDDFSEVLQQYMTVRNNDVNSSTCNDKEELQSVSSKVESSEKNLSIVDKEINVVTNNEKPVEILAKSNDENAASVNAVDKQEGSNLFTGKKFIVVGFGPKDTELLCSMIESNAGKVVSKDKTVKTAEIAVVPLIWTDLSIKVDTIVTNCWLQKCIEEETLLPFDENELFRPLDLELSKQPFKTYVISMSQYTGTERDCLMHLAEVLGAQCQEYFVRKANRNRGLLPNTHLIASLPEGSKYEAAKKWNIPAVTKHWLLDSARSALSLPVDKYLVDQQISAEVDTLKNDVSATEKQAATMNNSNMDKKQELASIKADDVLYLHANKSAVTEKTRVQELIAEDRAFSPKRLKLDESFQFDKPYEPKFNVSGILKDLDKSRESIGDKNHKRNASLPLEEMFSHNLNVAVQTMSNKCLNKENKLCKVDDKISATNLKNTSDANLNVLSGVVLFVSKKLSKLQMELNRIVESLGGSYTCIYDNSCTHYVFQGKTNDLNKEFRLARSHGKKIVSPNWVYACKESQSFVNEDLYPHTYKSRLNLSGQISTSKICETVKPSESTLKCNNDLYCNDKDELKFHDNGGVSGELNKDLDKLMDLTKIVINKRRLSQRSSSSPSSPNSIEKNKVIEKKPELIIDPERQGAKEEKPVEYVNTEPSQAPLMWEDPIERSEKSKACVLHGNKQSCNCSTEIKQDQKLGNVTNSKANEDLSLQARLHDNPSFFSSFQEPVMKKFMFTSFSEDEKQRYTSLVKKLGGQVSENKSFDNTATHLILAHPLKNEKFLASVASGKWVLHKSYLDECEEKQTFVAEDSYEWGGTNTKKFAPNSSESALFVCPRRWRVKLQGNKEISGAFHCWKVIVLTETQKMASYCRILSAGGAQVLSVNSPDFPNQLTHAFIEVKKNFVISDEIRSLMTHKVKCLKPEYLAYYIIEDPPPLEEQFLIPGLNDITNPPAVRPKRPMSHDVCKDKKPKLSEL